MSDFSPLGYFRESKGRSTQRRIAAQKGKPAPEFDRQQAVLEAAREMRELAQMVDDMWKYIPGDYRWSEDTYEVRLRRKAQGVIARFDAAMKEAGL